jgi:hypothetical protein
MHSFFTCISHANVAGQPLLQQLCQIIPSAAPPLPTLSHPPPAPSLSSKSKEFAGFKECGARPIELFNGRKAALAATGSDDSDGESIDSSTQMSCSTEGVNADCIGRVSGVGSK